jgi:Flagellar basal body-associated protein
MADDNEQELEIKPKGSKKKLIIIIVAAVLLLGGGGGAAWFFLFSGGKAHSEQKGGEAASDKTPEQQAAEKEAFYVGLPRAFVFNAHGNTRDRLVQIKVKLLVRGPENEALAKQHSPLVEGTLLKVFSAATVEQLTTVEGKAKLRKDATDEVTKALQELTGKPVVEQILFIGFVMQ